MDLRGEWPAGRLCRSCRCYEPEDPIGGHCTDRAPNPMAAKSCGPSFGCVFHSVDRDDRAGRPGVIHVDR